MPHAPCAAAATSVQRGPTIVIAGPPASGKGTQCKRIASCVGLVHVCMGDACREHAEGDGPLSRQVKEHMDRGDFVPDNLLLKIVKVELDRSDVIEHGCLLDGFPRTRMQALELKEHLDREVDAFMLLQVPDSLLVERALGRRIDPITGEIYHLSLVPPPSDLVPRLVIRSHDTWAVTVRRRIEVYRSYVDSITSAFTHKLWEVDGAPRPTIVFDTIIEHLKTLPQLSHLLVGSAMDEDDWGNDADDEVAEDTSLNLSLEASLSKDIGDSNADCHVVITVGVPDVVERSPVDICCVVDTSASMKKDASCDLDGQVVDNGLNCMDIVKHAVKCVVHMLKDDDRFTLTAYSDAAETIFPLQPMTGSGRESAESAVEALHPRLGTNIWSGLYAGMEALRIPTHDGKIRRKAVLLLTDGRDGHNHKFRGGHVAMLRNYKEAHIGFNFQLNTFGFGYEVDSKLLLSLAVEGEGTFAFIPDAAIVGTCFVNCIANFLGTHTQDATLHVAAQGGACLMGPVLGVPDSMVTEASWGRVVKLGPLQFGQSRDVVVPMQIPSQVRRTFGQRAMTKVELRDATADLGLDATQMEGLWTKLPTADDPEDWNAPYLESTIVWRTPDGRESRVTSWAADRVASPLAAVAVARCDVIRVGFEVFSNCELAATNGVAHGREEVIALVNLVADYAIMSQMHESVIALKADVEGRMTKALTGQRRFSRWGAHYLRALLRAHQLQLCTNFMDPGLQVYGGSLFRAIRDEGDEIFLSLPPPTHYEGPTKGVAKGRGKGERVAKGVAKGKGKGHGRAAWDEGHVAQNAEALVMPPQPCPDMSEYYGGAGGG